MVRGIETGTLNLNVGIGTIKNIATPIVFDCLKVDCLKLPNVDVVCDVQYLPFKNHSFLDVFCFHVLEHTRNPVQALRELIRVGIRMVELEVPHRYGTMARNHWGKDRNNVGLWHTCSFRTHWFHQCLKNFRRCVNVLMIFPWELRIHVWVYLKESK